jgi:hypothetical protein
MKTQHRAFFGLVFFIFFAPTLANADTIIQLNYPKQGNVLSSAGVSNQRFYRADITDPAYINSFIATGTMSTFTGMWRFINFGGFSSTTPYQLQLFKGTTPATGVILDCQSDPNAVAGDYGTVNVYATTTFEFTGTQCEIYPKNNYGFIIVGGSDSGATQWGIYASTTGNYISYLVADIDGPTNPDLIIPDAPDLAPVDFQTAFLDATAKGNSSSTISFDVDYVLNTAEYTANTRPDYINVQILNKDFFGSGTIASANKIILPLSDGFKTTNIPIDHSFSDGDFLAYFAFWNINTNRLTFEQTGIVVLFTVSGGVVTSSEVVELYNGETLGTDASIVYEDCNIYNLDGCVKNALIYTFVPSENAFEKFVTLYEKVQNKPPFGYVLAVKNQLAMLGSSNTPAFAFGDIPFQDAIFGNIRDFLIIGLWFLYAIFFLGRLNNLDI